MVRNKRILETDAVERNFKTQNTAGFWVKQMISEAN